MKYFECENSEAADNEEKMQRHHSEIKVRRHHNEALMRRHCGEVEITANPCEDPPMAVIIVVVQWCEPDFSEADQESMRRPQEHDDCVEAHRERGERLRPRRRSILKEDFHDILTKEWEPRE